MQTCSRERLHANEASVRSGLLRLPPNATRFFYMLLVRPLIRRALCERWAVFLFFFQSF